MLMDFYTNFQGYGICDVNRFTYHRRCPIRYHPKPPAKIQQQHIYPQPRWYSSHELGQTGDVYTFSDSELLGRWSGIPSYTDRIFDTTSNNQQDYEIPYFPDQEKTRQKFHANARSETLLPSHQGSDHRFRTRLPPRCGKDRDRFPKIYDTDQETHNYSVKDEDLDSCLDYSPVDYPYLPRRKHQTCPSPDPCCGSHSLYGTVFEDSNTDGNVSSVHGSEDNNDLPQYLHLSSSNESFAYIPEAFRPFFGISVGVAVEDKVCEADNPVFAEEQPVQQATRVVADGNHQDKCRGGHGDTSRSDHRCATIADSDEELGFSKPDLEAATALDQEPDSMTNRENMESDIEHHISSPSLPSGSPTAYFSQYRNSISSADQSPRNNLRFGHWSRVSSRLQRRKRRTSDLHKHFFNQAAINRERLKLEQDRAQLLQDRESLEQEHEKIEYERRELHDDYAQCRALRSRLRAHQEEMTTEMQELEEAWKDLREAQRQGFKGDRHWGQGWRYSNPFVDRVYAAGGRDFRCSIFDDSGINDLGGRDSPSRTNTQPLDALAAKKALETYISAWRANPIHPPIFWPTSSLTSSPLLNLPHHKAHVPQSWLEDPFSKRHDITKCNTITFFASAFALNVLITWPCDKEEEYEFKIPGLGKVEARVLKKMKECIGEEVKRWHQDKSDSWGLSDGERELAFAVFEGCVELRKCVRREVERRRGMGCGM